MRLLAVVCLLAAGVFSTELEHDGDIYEKYDVRRMLKNDGLRIAMYSCILDKVACGDFEVLKGPLDRIMKTKCADCNASQKATYEYTEKYLLQNHQDLYKEVIEKYGE